MDSNLTYEKDGTTHDIKADTYTIPGSGRFGDFVRDPVSGDRNVNRGTNEEGFR